MEFGIGYAAAEFTASMPSVAQEAERLGFDSVFLPEHSHIPLSTRFPIASDVPRLYKSMYDPFIALAAAASVTERIKLGTCITLITQRDPVQLAKEVATLDQISNGRVVLGIGAGWNIPEMETHGTDPNTRFRLMRERIEAMKVLWTEEVAEYHGKFVNIAPSWQWPKPVQKPNPPIMLGGSGPNVLKRVVRYCDGWLPAVSMVSRENTRGDTTPIDDFPDRMAELQKMAREEGRPKPLVQLGSHVATRFSIAELEEMGVTCITVTLGEVSEDEVQPALEALRKQADDLVAGRDPGPMVSPWRPED